MTSTAVDASPQPPVRRRPGRPRNTEVEPRAYKAVLELFGKHGWSGLTLDGVATHAGIGKSSMYLRWQDKRDLLLEAIRELEDTHINPDPDLDLRSYLIAYGHARGTLLLGAHGPVMANVVSAAATNPKEFVEIREESIDRGVLALTRRLGVAVDGGELPDGASATRLLDALEGAILFHTFIATRRTSPDALRAGLLEYVTSLVDSLLRGARA